MQQCQLCRPVGRLSSVSEIVLLLLSYNKSHQPVFNLSRSFEHLVLINDQKLLKACVLNANILVLVCKFSHRLKYMIN